MTTQFTGFSEEDLKRIKSGETRPKSELQVTNQNVRKIEKIGAKPKREVNKYKLPILQKQDSEENFDKLFDKCKLSIRTPPSPQSDDLSNNNIMTQDQDPTENTDSSDDFIPETERKDSVASNNTVVENMNNDFSRTSSIDSDIRKMSSETAPDIIRCADNYTEDEIATHKVKLEELQLQQKIMEEQNKKRKEMLAKALADRTKQTEEEVLRLEKIKKELEVLDGQFSQDVAVLRKKIDQACLSYAETEKHYLRVEKEFLQAKIQLQKEKEKKELLTEHLCALITHNETRKAQKLETLMLELATDNNVKESNKRVIDNDRKCVMNDTVADDDDSPVIVDGVDQKTGKMVEFS